MNKEGTKDLINLEDILAIAEKREKTAKKRAKARATLAEKKAKELSNRPNKIISDIENYEKIIASPYAKDMKSVAWDALVTAYPESIDVVRYDVAALLVTLGIHFTFIDSQNGLMWTKDSNLSNKEMT